MLIATGFHLVGEAATSEDCAEMIARELPELLICGEFCAPLPDGSAFPVVITLGGAIATERAVCNLAIPLRQDRVAEALAIASRHILQIEIEDLFRLVQVYTANSGSPEAKADRMIVDSESGQPVPVSQILWIKAAGNYVQLFTREGRFELRDTISNMAAKLERSGFVRIHRGTVVNTDAVRGRTISDGVVQGVILDDGTELPVGPNFRQQLSSGRAVFPIANSNLEEGWPCSK